MRTTEEVPHLQYQRAAGYAGMKYTLGPPLWKTARDARHKAAMQKQKPKVDAGIAAADLERGVALLLTGDGRASQLRLRHGDARAGLRPEGGRHPVHQGRALSGEEICLRNGAPGGLLPDGHRVYLGHPGSQRRHRRRPAHLGAVARPMLRDASFDLVVLDELTYMIAFKYLPEEDIIGHCQPTGPARAWW